MLCVLGDRNMATHADPARARALCNQTQRRRDLRLARLEHAEPRDLGLSRNRARAAPRCRGGDRRAERARDAVAADRAAVAARREEAV